MKCYLILRKKSVLFACVPILLWRCVKTLKGILFCTFDTCCHGVKDVVICSIHLLNCCGTYFILRYWCQLFFVILLKGFAKCMLLRRTYGGKIFSKICIGTVPYLSNKSFCFIFYYRNYLYVSRVVEVVLCTVFPVEN